jgi:UDP-N-acetylglucosamine acyltransferase
LIDPAAKIHPDARIGDGVAIGPWSIIDGDVEIGEGTWIGPHVVIRGPTRIGAGNRIHQFCSIGDAPQDKKYDGGGPSRLEIGDGNVIREFCTINRGTPGGGGLTRIGSHNWIMAYVHIAHDCFIGDRTVFANNATLAGHVLVEDHAILGGFTGVHQYCRIGRYSFTGISSVIVKDVPPYVLVAGSPARPHGLNREGLRRHGFAPDDLERLRAAYRTVYREGLRLAEALDRLDALAADCAHVRVFADFIRTSRRGIVR